MLLLDVLFDREPHAESSSAVWRVIEEGRVEGLLPARGDADLLPAAQRSAKSEDGTAGDGILTAGL